MAITNSGPIDAALSVTKALPAAAANNNTDALDLQSIAPNSDGWRLGRLRVSVPALPNLVDTTKNLVLTLYAAKASTSSSPAPAAPTAGAFVIPTVKQTITIPGVATTGTSALVAYFNIPVDAYGSTYEFVRVNQAIDAGGGDNAASSVTYSWERS